jgi:hypothetical protein
MAHRRKRSTVGGQSTREKHSSLLIPGLTCLVSFIQKEEQLFRKKILADMLALLLSQNLA